MAKESQIDTEQKILNAARKVFIEKGRDGARMQGIADEAGINKSLLHYYFRSKDKLFAAIFDEAFKSFIPNVKNILESGMLLADQVKSIVGFYFDMILENPYLPGFILDELSHNPKTFQLPIMANGTDFSFIQKALASLVAQGYSIECDPRHLFVDMIGMTVMPFIGRPILEEVLFGGQASAYEAFIQERREHVTDIILNQIKKEDEAT